MGDRRIMEAMIKAAASVGVDIIKFQSFKADKLRKDWPDYENAYRYYRQHELSESDHKFIMLKCHENDIEFLTTVFSLETVDFLADELGLKQVKIASPDANNWELIDKCLEKFEKVFISAGMHKIKEIADLARYINLKTPREERSKATVFHCVSLYPVRPERVDMAMLKIIEKMFGGNGFSDHTITLDASKLAISLGADYIERHFTLSRWLPGNDQHISSTPEEFAELAAWRDKVDVMTGKSVRELSPDELANREKYRGRWSA